RPDRAAEPVRPDGLEPRRGARLYTAADVARLQQILSLKMLGFGLEQIREYLSRGDYDPRRVVLLHLERVRGQADELRRLAERLAALANALDKAEVVSADEFLATIEVMLAALQRGRRQTS